MRAAKVNFLYLMQKDYGSVMVMLLSAFEVTALLSVTCGAFFSISSSRSFNLPLKVPMVMVCAASSLSTSLASTPPQVFITEARSLILARLAPGILISTALTDFFLAPNKPPTWSARPLTCVAVFCAVPTAFWAVAPALFTRGGARGAAAGAGGARGAAGF